MFLSDLGSQSALSWFLIIGSGLLLGWFIATRRNNFDNKNQVIDLSAEDFRANMRKGQLIDIRTEEDYAVEKILGSRNFPKRSITQNLFKLRTDQAVFIYDNNDKGRIRSVANKLVKKGYKPVYILKEGFSNWPFIKK